MRNCEACVAFRLKEKHSIVAYPPDLDWCGHVSADQCLGDITEQVVGTEELIPGYTLDKFEKILGSVTRCEKYPQLGWHDPFPS